MGAGWPAHRGLLSRSHLDDDAGRATGEGAEHRDRVGVEREPAWSPDGTRVAFASNRGDGFDIFVAARGGVAVP